MDNLSEYLEHMGKAKIYGWAIRFNDLVHLGRYNSRVAFCGQKTGRMYALYNPKRVLATNTFCPNCLATEEGRKMHNRLLYYSI